MIFLSVPGVSEWGARDESFERADDHAVADRYARRRQLGRDLDAEFERAVEKAGQGAHRAGGNVVQHHERPLVGQGVGERALGPAFRILPVARHAVPQHARVAAVAEVLHRDVREQAWTEHAARAVGTKPAFGRGEFAEQCLRVADLLRRRVAIGARTELDGVRECVIADAMAGVARAADQIPARGVAEKQTSHRRIAASRCL